MKHKLSEIEKFLADNPRKCFQVINNKTEVMSIRNTYNYLAIGEAVEHAGEDLTFSVRGTYAYLRKFDKEDGFKFANHATKEEMKEGSKLFDLLEKYVDLEN